MVIKSFNETKYMSFLIKDNEFLEKYNTIWDKISNSIKKGFDREPVYKEKYLKTKNNMKIKSIHIFMMMEYKKKALTIFVNP